MIPCADNNSSHKVLPTSPQQLDISTGHGTLSVFNVMAVGSIQSEGTVSLEVPGP